MGGFREGYNSDEDFEMKGEDVKWIGKGVPEKDRVFYSGVILDGSLELRQGDTVFVKQHDPQAQHRVATIGKLYYESTLGASAHLQWFRYATDTFLGDTADPQQLFFTDDCSNVSLSQIWEKCTVVRRLGTSSSLHETMLEPDVFWAWHWHDGGTRLEELEAPIKILQEQDDFLSFCEACARKTAKDAEKKPEVVRDQKNKIVGIRWKGKILGCGDGVMIPSNTVKLRGKLHERKANRLLELEEQTKDIYNDIYTEHYRKKEEQIKSQSRPLQIGQILEIKKKTKSISLKIRRFYRPGDC